jgi:hypothetical protein
MGVVGGSIGVVDRGWEWWVDRSAWSIVYGRGGWIDRHGRSPMGMVGGSIGMVGAKHSANHPGPD